MVDDRYLTIKNEALVETKVVGSRFIAESCLIADAASAQTRLDQIRKREHAATHHCFAYRVGAAPNILFKYSDDGEPTGSAGKPIYAVLAGADLTNSLVVVTRYFGGTKLGPGGLSRAYGSAAQAVIEQSGIQENFITRRFRMTLEFAQYERWRQVMSSLQATATGTKFAANVVMDVSVRAGRAEQLCAAFIELTAGKGLIEPAKD